MNDEARIIREAISYDPTNGTFTWRTDRPEHHYKRKGHHSNYMEQKAGKPVDFSEAKGGYSVVRICKKKYQAHTIAIACETGSLPHEGHEVDHIDGDITNNRYNNLRVVSKKHNQRNRRMSRKNISGISCVSWHKKQLRWHVVVSSDDGRKFLGSFDSLLDAAAEKVSWFNRNSSEQNFTNRHGK